MAVLSYYLKDAEGSVWRPPPEKLLRFQALRKCILVDPRDGFAMDNGKSNKLPSDRGSGPPDPPPGSATAVTYALGYVSFFFTHCLKVLH